ncbi:hypothetical protein QWT69_16900 [Sporosarcina oncorhynchi]|uniref:Uncharacterized protein n=1 Tax=Sporosarcina oncorhynchi TaxID=3056444 RepID=A0ABZ0L4T3_9BACL|nr:hypothetical protein [Sporosarcina sp. T2O-4]WOV87503.1 hypothetical protein QWT69_16900 [Sporosarcina sp. T2O-4]
MGRIVDRFGRELGVYERGVMVERFLHDVERIWPMVERFLHDVERIWP